MILGVDLARSGHLEGEGVLLLGFHPLLARGLGLAAFAFEFLAFALLLLGLDQTPGELQRLGDLLQLVDGVVFEIGDLALDRIGKRRRGDVEPQGDRISAHGLRIDDHPVGRNAVETEPGDLRTRRGEVEHRLVLQRPLGLRKHLAAERLVGEHAEIELRFGGHVPADRVVPHAEIGHLGRVVGPFEETHLVATRLVHLIVVLILNGIDAVGDRLEVLGDEDAVVLGTGDGRGFVLEDRGVVSGDLLDRVGREEPDEALRHGVGLVTVGRIARKDHRVDLGTRREDVAHRIERVALVVVADGAAEIERIGRIRGQRVAQLHDDAPAAQGDERLFLHRRRGEELLLLVLELHELIELDVDLPVADRRPAGREVVGRHVHDDGGQRVAGTSRGGHHARTAAHKGRSEEQRHRKAQHVKHMSRSVHRRRDCVWGFVSGARDASTKRQPSST